MPGLGSRWFSDCDVPDLILFPERYRVIEGRNVSYGWWNRLPGTRPDGSHYEFMGTSYKVYAGDGRFSYHEDVYNLKQGIEVIKEWTAAQEG